MATSNQEEVEFILKTYFTIPVGDPYDENVLKKLKEFEVKDSDVFLIGFPKTGTTWAQEMIWLIGNDLDFEGSKKFVDERFPVLELFSFYGLSTDPTIPEYHKDSLEFIKKQKSPRFIKTHLRGTYLPEQIQNRTKNSKIIYITRDVKDACISMYYYTKNLLKYYNGNLEDFCKVYLAGRQGAGSFWEHVLFFWNRRHESNVLFLKYEEMKKDLPAVIKQVASFLDKTLTDEQVTTLTKWLHMDSMRSNPAVNHEILYKQSGFIRKGKVGGFKEEMSPEMIEKFDAWTRACLSGSDFAV